VDGIDFARYSGPQLWDKLQNLSGALVKNWEWSAFSLSLSSFTCTADAI
jgi:hypothetical protein